MNGEADRERRSSGGSGASTSLLYRWFVEYNPLFFFSAACVLLGVCLVSSGLGQLGWKRGQLVLVACVAAYQLLLLAGAALLFRRGAQKRPGVILGLLQLVFVFDPTLQTEVMSTLGTPGRVASLAWVASVPLGLMALSWVFHLRTSAVLIPLASLAALGVASTPHLLGRAGSDGADLHLGATWFLAVLVILAVELRPRIWSADRLDSWGLTVVRRAGKALLWISGAFYLAHLAAWLTQFGLTLSPSHAAPFLVLLPYLVRGGRERWAWTASIGALAAAGTVPPTLAPTAGLVALNLAWHAHRTRQPRLLVGAVLALYLAALSAGWQSGPLPRPELWLGVSAAIALSVLSVVAGLPSAAATAPFVLLPHVRTVVPRGPLEMGIALVAVGFVTLVLGVAISWNRRPSPARGRV